MKALVTGFDPFGGDSVNPSSLAVGMLARRIGPLMVHTAELPTSYARSAAALAKAIGKVQPDIVLCVGQAGGRTELSLERVAINIQDARVAEGLGVEPSIFPEMDLGEVVELGAGHRGEDRMVEGDLAEHLVATDRRPPRLPRKTPRHRADRQRPPRRRQPPPV